MAPRNSSPKQVAGQIPFKFRGSGILLHPTSLPGGHGTGDLGKEARSFAHWLHKAGQSYWQMLPLCPPGMAHSPYDSPAANAVSPLLVSLDDLLAKKLITRGEYSKIPQALSAEKAKFDLAGLVKERLLRAAHQRFSQGVTPKNKRAYQEFCHRESAWLDDYALFNALKQAQNNLPWCDWDKGLRDRAPTQLARARKELSEEVDYHRFVQFELDVQWRQLRDLCHSLGVLLMGDLPIYVAYDSVDVWAHRDVFHLDRSGRRKCVAGVPPDYFSKTGQLWGNPLYNWKHLEQSGFAWWVERMRVMLNRFDAVRLDHFIGFRHYWEVPATAKTAEHGRYVRVPAEKLFATLRSRFGQLPFLAEDLGLVTEAIHQLRDGCGFPGMRILQFAFDDPRGSDYLPHRYIKNAVVYTGTHDNDTFVGWLRNKTPAQQRALAYVGAVRKEAHWEFVRLALQSVADTAIFPIQDILGLGSESRMNRPATMAGNWAFRLRSGSLKDATAEKLFEYCARYERIPKVDS